jgi:hypothetical protein
MIELVKELHYGANILLGYFHYCTKGFHPFSLAWNAEESLSMADLNTEQIEFVKMTAAYVKANGESNSNLPWISVANRTIRVSIQGDIRQGAL